MNLRYFISRIDTLKKTSNYKKKGPYIYCAVKRLLNLNPYLSLFLDLINLYHAGIFEWLKNY